MVNFVIWLASCIVVSASFFEWLGFAKILVKIIFAIIIRCQNRIIWLGDNQHTTQWGHPFLNAYSQSCGQWKWFFTTSRTPQIPEIVWYYTSCVISRTPQMPLWKVGKLDRYDRLKWERRHWKKDHFWTKSYHVTSVANNVANPLVFDLPLFYETSSCYSQSMLKVKIWLLLDRNFKVHFHWARDEIM